MHIALLQNTSQDARSATSSLQRRGHHVSGFSSVGELDVLLRREPIALLILDWRADAADLLTLARERMGAALPVLCLCATHDAEAIDAIFHAQVSDYQLKPLRQSELLARCDALLRRAYPTQPTAEWQSFGPFAFDAQTGTLEISGRRLALTRKEFDLALLFFRHLGRPLSRAFLQESVWGHEADATRSLSSRTVDTHVSRVRSKLGLEAGQGFRLVPVYSYGYKLEELGAGLAE